MVAMFARVFGSVQENREQRMSLRDFGKHAGVHPFHVMAIELGQLATMTKVLHAIAKALGARFRMRGVTIHGRGIGP